MTSFIQVDYPTEHGGVVRFERAAKTLSSATRRAGGAGFLTAAIVSALLVVANQVVDTWTEGHLLAAWIALWAIAFAVLALVAAPVHRAAVGLKAQFAAWRAARREAAEDRKLWALAQDDARIMADLSRAMSQAAEQGAARPF
jgi:hypothetical protein